MRLLTCILIALAFVAIYADEPEKLVNGTPTTIKEWPHAISLRLNNQHSCGGSIISSKCILTAAHCVEPFKSTRGLTVVSGTTYLNSGGVHHEIAELKAHEGYGEDGSHDIGLIKLSQPIKFDENTQPIKLPTSDIEKGDGVTLVAWGSKGFLRPIHNDLQKIEANCMPWDECKRKHILMPVHDTEFCTLISKGTGACNGDSGSGVIRNSDKTIVGLVSRGVPCARGFPDVFTNVCKYVDWIKANGC